MEIKTLVIYSSVDGQTLRICQNIVAILTKDSHYVDLCSINEFGGQIGDYDKIVIASRIRYGKHDKKVKRFVDANAEYLNAHKKTAFVSVNLVARKAEKNTPETNPYVVKFLNGSKWKPKMVGVFAGRLDYKHYTLVDNLLIKLVMLITKGPTHATEAIEFTDWESVRRFSVQLSEL